MEEKCAVCNKCMAFEDDDTYCMGIHVGLYDLNNGKKRGFLQEQYGKYELKDYGICFECLLKSLGVKHTK